MKLIQMVPQFLKSQLDVFFYRSHGDTQLGGNLLVGELLIAAQLENQAALGRHFIDEFCDSEMGFVVFGLKLGVLGGRFPDRRIGIGHHQMPLGFEHIQGGVPGKDGQVILEGQGRVQTVPVQPDFHEDTLGQVFCQGGVFDQRENESFHLGIPAQEKRIESAVIPIPHGGNEVAIRHFPVFVHVESHGTI